MKCIYLVAAALLASCGTVPPSSSFDHPCTGNICPDVFESDNHISNNDSGIDGKKDDSTPDTDTYSDPEVSKDIAGNQYICPAPKDIPQNCIPKQITQGKCQFDGVQNYTCTGFYAGKTCKTDKDCNDFTNLYADAEKVAAEGKCENSLEGTCNKISDSSQMECGGLSPYQGKQCWSNSDCIDFSQRTCKGGWFEVYSCKDNKSICNDSIVPPCVCWEFCEYMGVWKQTNAELYFDFSVLKEKNKTCQIGGFTAIPGNPSVKAVTSTNDTSELILMDNTHLKKKDCGNNNCSELMFTRYN